MIYTASDVAAMRRIVHRLIAAEDRFPSFRVSGHDWRNQVETELQTYISAGVTLQDLDKLLTAALIEAEEAAAERAERNRKASEKPSGYAITPLQPPAQKKKWWQL